ncbi:hypothetical protein Tco_0209101 [Tanacetum coccineum]
MAQQVIPATQLVSRFHTIRRCNNYAVLQSIPCSPECKIVGQILLDHPLSYALTATADVPVVYLQRFWRTVSKVPCPEDTIKFMLNTQEFIYTVDMFLDILYLPVETPENPLVAPVNIETIKAFMNRVGYQGVVDKINILKMFHAMINRTNVDYAALLWWDFMNNVNQKKEVIQYPRFINLIIADLIKKFLDIPQRIEEDYHSIKDDIPLEIRATDNFKEYETVFMNVVVLMNQSQLVVTTQGTHRSTPRAYRTPTLTASPWGKKRKQRVGESSSTLKSLKITIRQQKVVEGEKDDDDSENKLEPKSHKDNPEHVDDDDDKDVEKSSTFNTSCTNDDIHSHHDDHQDDDAPPKGEKRVKRHKALKSSKSVRGSSSKHSAKDSTTYVSRQQQQEWYAWVEEIVIDEDEVILEDETPKLITELQDVDKRVPTIFDYERMKATLNDVLSNQFKNAEEYAYHLEQITNFMKNQIVWESRHEDIRRSVPRPLVFFGPQRNLNKPTRYLYNKDLFFLNHGNTKEKKHILSLHKIHAEQFPEVDLEEKINCWVRKEFKTFNEDARLLIQHWKDSWHKRVMYLTEIVRFCDAILEKVLKEVKLKIFQSEPWRKPPLLGELDHNILRAFEREITKRLSHREQMRRWESFVNGRAILPMMKRL